MRIIILFFLLLNISLAFSQNAFETKVIAKVWQPTSVSGSSALHQKTFTFYRFEERLLNNQVELFTLATDANGAFKSEFLLDEISFVFTENGGVRYYFYAVPGMQHALSLQLFEGKSLEDDYLPVRSEVHLMLTGAEGADQCLPLNTAIMSYNEIFEPFYNKQILRYYASDFSKDMLDSFLLSSQITQSVCSPAYYEEYVKYKQGVLEFTVREFDLDSIIQKYFSQKAVLLNNPAWWELFENIYEKYFSFLSKKDAFSNLYKFMDLAHYPALDSLLKTDPGLQNDTTRALVIIREVNNEFHEGYFSVDKLSNLLDSLASKTNCELCKDLAIEVKIKNTRLLAGKEAPEINLTDIYGSQISTETLKGKFVYLGFCKANSLDCLKEFEFLRYYHGKYSNQLAIVTVIDDLNTEEIMLFREQHAYPWIMLNGKDFPDLYEDFNVRGSPSFFLISPEGKISLAPAMLPSEGFEAIFFSLMRELRSAMDPPPGPLP
jgi:peroxiredoxin